MIQTMTVDWTTCVRRTLDSSEVQNEGKVGSTEVGYTRCLPIVRSLRASSARALRTITGIYGFLALGQQTLSSQTSSEVDSNVTVHSIATNDGLRENSAENLSYVDVLSPYSFAIGTNFDFVDGVDAEDLYFSLASFTPDVVKVGPLNVGFDIGVRKGYVVSFASDESQVTLLERGIQSDGQYTVSTIESIENINLSLTNTDWYIRLFARLGRANAFSGTRLRSNIFLGLDVGILQQRLDYQVTYDDRNITRDIVTLDEYLSTVETEKKSFDDYDQYIPSIGVVLPVIVEDSRAVFIAGLGAGVTEIEAKNRFRNKRTYLKSSVEIIEKRFGLTMRAEYRYFFRNTERSSPFFGFSVAKYIRLERLIDFTKVGA